jgi:hypothetical protein
MSADDELEEIELRLRPVAGLFFEAGHVTIGADGLAGLLEWFSDEGDRPDVLAAIAAAVNAAPRLLADLRALRGEVERMRAVAALVDDHVETLNFAALDVAAMKRLGEDSEDAMQLARVVNEFLDDYHAAKETGR